MNGTFSAPELSLAVKGIGEVDMLQEDLVCMLQHGTDVLLLLSLIHI